MIKLFIGRTLYLFKLCVHFVISVSSDNCLVNLSQQIIFVLLLFYCSRFMTQADIVADTKLTHAHGENIFFFVFVIKCFISQDTNIIIFWSQDCRTARLHKKDSYLPPLASRVVAHIFLTYIFPRPSSNLLITVSYLCVS